MKHIRFALFFCVGFAGCVSLLLAGCAPREDKINRDIEHMHTHFTCNPPQTTLDIRACPYNGKY